MSEDRTVIRRAVLMQTEVRVRQSSTQRATWCQTAHTGKWGGSSWSEQSYL